MTIWVVGTYHLLRSGGVIKRSIVDIWERGGIAESAVGIKTLYTCSGELTIDLGPLKIEVNRRSTIYNNGAKLSGVLLTFI